MQRVHHDLWFVKQIFNLGEGETEGLRYEGLRERVLTVLGEDAFSHPSLNMHANQESTMEQLQEEKDNIRALLSHKPMPFPIDTTMAVVRRYVEDKSLLTLISPVKCDAAVLEAIKLEGEVAEIVVPSLQHWIFTEDLAAKFPAARILCAPPACGEDLYEKMPSLVPRMGMLSNGTLQFGEKLHARLLEGAPLNMNEFLFWHEPSCTLIASDAFYGGHTEETTWFQRLWFKLTKGGSFKACRLPVYRTMRVKSDGSVPDLLACVDLIVKEWDITQIIFAHGTNPYTKDAAAAFCTSWHVLEGSGSQGDNAHDHTIKPVTCNEDSAAITGCC